MKKYLYFLVLVASPVWASLTVSGLSSGAYFAQQFHVAFSAEVTGAGVIAGGPFWCAKGNVNDALNRCMDTAAGAPRVDESLNEARRREREGKVDELKNLSNDRVYLLSGRADRTVLPVMTLRLRDFYQKLSVTKILVEDSLPVGHAFPTDSYGNPCEEPSKPPYISNCGRDIAGEMLTHLIPSLKAKAQASDERIFTFPQAQGVDPQVISLAKTGYAYVPEACASKQNDCHLHVAFHGCRQTTEDIGLDFIYHSGYNEWAEANQIIVLYPQAVRNFLLSNPRGCWDWWGYTGPLYHTKDGPQMRMISQVIELWKNNKLPLKQWDGKL
jgi:hypothetical protein